MLWTTFLILSLAGVATLAFPQTASVEVRASQCVGCNDPVLFGKLVGILPSHLKNVTRVNRVSTQVIDRSTKYTVEFIANGNNSCKVIWNEEPGRSLKLENVSCVA